MKPIIVKKLAMKAFRVWWLFELVLLSLFLRLSLDLLFLEADFFFAIS